MGTSEPLLMHCSSQLDLRMSCWPSRIMLLTFTLTSGFIQTKSEHHTNVRLKTYVPRSPWASRCRTRIGDDAVRGRSRVLHHGRAFLACQNLQLALAADRLVAVHNACARQLALHDTPLRSATACAVEGAPLLCIQSSRRSNTWPFRTTAATLAACKCGAISARPCHSHNNEGQGRSSNRWSQPSFRGIRPSLSTHPPCVRTGGKRPSPLATRASAFVVGQPLRSQSAVRCAPQCMHL